MPTEDVKKEQSLNKNAGLIVGINTRVPIPSKFSIPVGLNPYILHKQPSISSCHSDILSTSPPGTKQRLRNKWY